MFNIITFSIGIILTTKMSLLTFILIVYFFPIVINNIFNLILFKNRKIKNYLITSLITTLCYFIFSLYFISHPNFNNFISENKKDTGNIIIEINSGLANIEQLIFVFLINFMSIFLLNLLLKKEDINVRSKKFK